MILLIRTDKPEAELYLYDKNGQVDVFKWEAHRQLAETLHKKIKELLDENNIEWSGLTGIGCFKGPGSFTGLRIGLTVANALANSLSVPVIAEGSDDWAKRCVERLGNHENDHIAKPDYGRPAHITQQKK
jgi:tRNA threonylcarbamoyladenosine biosynthesis protein TsaB